MQLLLHFCITIPRIYIFLSSLGAACVHSARGVTGITICLIKMQCMRFLCSYCALICNRMHACAGGFISMQHAQCSFFLSASSSPLVYVCVCNRFGKHSTLSFACRRLDLWQDATLVVLACTYTHVMWRDAWLRRSKPLALCWRVLFLCQPQLLMKLYVSVCCRKKTHFWITTCPASSLYLRTNDRDSAGFLLILVSTTLLLCLFFSLLSCGHTLSVYFVMSSNDPNVGLVKIFEIEAAYLLN